MFDKLIESDTKGAEFKNRSRYFMVSSVVVGILFLSAVVFSLYAADIGLGNDEFEISMMLAPQAPDAPEPEQPQPRQQRYQQMQSDRPERQANINQIAQSTLIPASISSIPNTQRERLNAAFDIGRFDIDPQNSGGGQHIGGPIGNGNPVGTGSRPAETTVAAAEAVPEPPPALKKPEPKNAPPRSKGVVNGFAINLPKPPYPAIAKTMNLSGDVNVQVTIDESGRVVSARAVTGHAFFKSEAERAAKQATFRPTLLSDKPVKVTGIIVYRFSRN